MKSDITVISKKQQAYEFIRSQIYNGTYGAGYRIVIDRVAQELELSNSPVREAIQQLEAEGIVQIIPYSGAVVQVFNEFDYVDVMVVLSALEGVATALACNSLTDADIAKLEQINDAIKKAVDEYDFDQIGDLNLKFHTVIHERCGNSYLVDKLRQTWQRLAQIRKSGYSLVPQRAKISIKEHEELIQLFKEKASPKVVEASIRQHKQAMIDSVHNRQLMKEAK